MKGTLLALLLVARLTGIAAEQLMPAGSLVQCTVSEPKLSSKTADIGDPVLCQVSHVEMYGRSVFPYGSYMVGRFEDYRDPGHFVGKGWMELKFVRMIVGNDTVIPITTRVVATSAKYPVDRDGRIHGTGHPTRDAIEWMIPLLWPIDLINLPRRGPYPVLKPETRLTVMLLDDLGIPTKSEVQQQPQPISPYNYADQESRQQPAPIERVPPASAPIERSYAQLPIQQPYALPNPMLVLVQAPAPAPVVVQQPPVIYGYPPGPYGYPPPPPMGYGYPPVAYGYYYRPY